MTKRLIITAKIEPDGATIRLIGRDAWALQQLVQAGEKGCTPLTHVGPRWSAYIFKLRKFGFDIETVHESHEGQFAGNHARYVLQSNVTILSDGLAVAA